MSIFTSRVTKTIEIPHDPGQTVTIRKLAPRHLEQASRASQLKSIADLKEIGGPAFLKELQTLSDTVLKEAKVADPTLTFDKIVLLEKAVVDWSYDAARTAEVFADLDEQTLNLLATEVLKLSKPSLFQTTEESEDAKKKD